METVMHKIQVADSKSAFLYKLAYGADAKGPRGGTSGKAVDADFVAEGYQYNYDAPKWLRIMESLINRYHSEISQEKLNPNQLRVLDDISHKLTYKKETDTEEIAWDFDFASIDDERWYLKPESE